MRLRDVIVEDKILILVRVDRVRLPHDLKTRERSRRAGQLQLRLLEMIRIEMAIAAGPDELADLEPALLREDVREQCVACDVERHAEEDVARALVELQRKLAVGDVRLEQAVARRERHCVEVARIPSADDLAARGGVGPDLRDQLGDLVDVAPIRGDPVAPLLAVDRAEVAILVRPLIPNRDFAVLQPADVSVAAQEPQQLDDDRAEVKLLGREHGEALREIEAHLRAEHAERAGAGAVHRLDAGREHAVHEV